MKKAQVQNAKAWEQTRRLSLWKYVLLNGVFQAIIVCFISRLVDLNNHSFSEIYFSVSGAICMLGFIAGGIVLYLTTWWFSEHNYKRVREIDLNAKDALL